MFLSRRHLLIRLIPLVISLVLFTCQERIFENPHDETSVADPSSWAPTNLQAQELADSTIKLTWKQEKENIDGFKIDRQVGTLEWMKIANSIADSSREWIDTTLVIDTMLYYRIYAYAGNNYSAYDSTTSFIQSVRGCTDSDAANYDPEAQTNDGSCIYPLVVISPNGDEEWEIGSEQTITWERNDLSKMIGGDFDLPPNKLIPKKKMAVNKSRSIIKTQKNSQMPIMKGNKKSTMARADISSKIQELNGTVPMSVANNSGKVKIELYSEGTINATIAESTDDDGSFSWTILSDNNDGGSTYKIRITDITDTSVYAESEGYFTLLPEVLPTEGLVAYYPFNGNANDESGNGNDGDINEGTDSGPTLTTDRFGNDNSAYSFDGDNDFIEVQHSNALNIFETDFTITLFFNTNQNETDHTKLIFDKRMNDGSSAIAIGNSNGNLSFHLEDETHYYQIYSEPISDGEWHFAVLLRTVNQMQMSIDGDWINESVNISELENINNISDMKIGARFDETEFYQGYMDELRIYNRALTEAEIEDLYCGGGWCIEGCTDINATNYNANANIDDDSCTYDTPTEGLVAYYPFNGNAKDESSNGNDGTVNDATLTADRFGSDNSAYSFDGVDDRIKLNKNSIDELDTFTIGLWSKTSDSGSIKHFISAANANEHNEFLIRHDNGSVIIIVKGIEHQYSSSINDNSWHYLVLMRVNSTTKLYVDGILNSDWTSTPTGKIKVDTSGLWLGGDQDCVGGCWDTGDQYEGLIDDIRVYNLALDEEEIQELYCEGGWCIEGCTDINATNYNTNANIDDGSCTYDTPTEGLVAYYPFTGNAEDASGNGNDGDINEGTDSGPTLTTDRFGNDNSAYSFDGVNDYVDIGKPIGDYHTISFWAKNDIEISTDMGTELMGSPGTIYGGIGFGGITTACRDEVVGLYSGTGTTQITCWDSSDISRIPINWHHYAFVYESNNYRLYFDNVNQGSGDIGDYDFGGLISGSSLTNNWTIGSYTSGYWDGKIDDIRIYNIALTEAEIEELYCDGGWCIEGCTNPDATNYEPSANVDDGTCEFITNGLVTYYPFEKTSMNSLLLDGLKGVQGVIGGSIEFDGSNNMRVFNEVSPNGADFSFFTWINFYDLETEYIIGDRKENSNVGWFIHTYSDGNLQFGYKGDILVNCYVTTTIGNVISINNWYHIGFVINSQNNEMIAYVNGIIVGNFIDNHCSSVGVNHDDLLIGHSHEGGFLTGKIDEFVVYNNALGNNNVIELYNNGAGKRVDETTYGMTNVIYYNDMDVLTDMSGNGNYGAANGNPTQTATGYNETSNNSAMEFDGIDDKVCIDLYNTEQNTGTISVWFKSDNSSSEIMGQDANGWNNLDTNFGIGIQNAVCGTENKLTFSTHGPVTSDVRCVSSTTSVGDNNWHHGVAVVTGSQYQIWVDGVNEANISTDYGIWGANGSTELCFPEDANYNGNLDEVRIYNRALSASEIQALYQQ